MTEPTRPLPRPEPNPDGSLNGASATSPEDLKTRGALAVHSIRVIPVILVPGVMGSNLRASTNPKQPRNAELAPGQAAWRPPHGKWAGIQEASTWKTRTPVQRQHILDASTLEVDDTGILDISSGEFALTDAQARQRGWGELHWDSYGKLLETLETNLNHTFELNWLRNKVVRSYWQKVMKHKNAEWDAAGMPNLTEAELLKYSAYQYPVYACGYNWLESNAKSAERLQKRITDVMKFWTDRKHICTQVIVLTHSMGGLVTRACAKNMEGQIAGIVHSVMPALGAPLAYRRIACGMETSSPSNGWVDNIATGKVADIVGRTPEETMAVMAVAPGGLELLPNHLYPGPWLFASTKQKGGGFDDVMKLPQGNPYDLYRDSKPWYRLIDPGLADPARKYRGEKRGVDGAISDAIQQAENFHTKLLDTYYHPNTYAFYGVDPKHLSYGVFRWVSGVEDDAGKLALKNGRLLEASPLSNFAGGGRNIQLITTGGSATFQPSVQDTNGDGTVPHQSGAGPTGKVKQVFRTTGYDHQGSYSDDSMIMLTHHLIVKIAQAVK